MRRRLAAPPGLRALRPPSLGLSAAPPFCSAFRAGAADGERSGVRVGEGGIRGGGQELHVDVGRWLRPALPSHRHVPSGPADPGARPARVPSPALSSGTGGPAQNANKRDRNR